MSKVSELLTDESKWTQEAYARDSDGCRLFNEFSPRAKSFCLLGAIYRCYKESDEEITIALKVRDKINEDIQNWNDHPNRTFAEVRALIEELDI